MLTNIKANRTNSVLRDLPQILHIDATLFTLLFVTGILGLVVLYSATSGSDDAILRQSIRFSIGMTALLVLANINIERLKHLSPWLYAGGVVLLLIVMYVGHIGKGAQRWLDLGFFRFQPSELMKIFVPMMVAWYFASKPIPPLFRHILVALLIVAAPVFLIIEQPDLGTAILVAMAGMFIIFLAGTSWRLITIFSGVILACVPLLWIYLLRDYQRQRVLTLFNPESDPLGTGYHIIQSMIAIGSGGLYGKGWTNGTQSQLDFIPERSTDFIFAVFSEEFGFFGVVLLLSLYLALIVRGLHIAIEAQDTYSRLLAGTLSLSFFSYVVVNIGMVSGMLPVVGVPLPMISYGGTSIVSLLAGFGILMSIHSHRRLMGK